MIKAIISDFSRTLLFPKDGFYNGSLNELCRQLQDLPDFKFFDYFVWNELLAKFYKRLSTEKSISINIFTTDKIQENPALAEYISEIFDNVFTVKDLNGLVKENPKAYEVLAAKLNLTPNEILFIDDSEMNIKSAQKAGLHTVKYENITQVILDVNKIIL